MDSKTYGFLVPETLAPGTYEVAILNNSKTVSLTVKAAAAIPDPAGYTQDWLNQADLQLERAITIQNGLVEQGLLSATAAEQERLNRKKKITDAAAQFHALSAQDQKRAAQFMAANRAGLDSLTSFLADFGSLAPSKSGRLRTGCPLGIIDEYSR